MKTYKVLFTKERNWSKAIDRRTRQPLPGITKYQIVDAANAADATRAVLSEHRLRYDQVLGVAEVTGLKRSSY